MYDRSRSVYEQTPLFFSLKNTDRGYIIPDRPVIKTGDKKISFAIQAYDRISGSTNTNGIYSASLFLDEQPQISFSLDNIDYNETHYVNAQIDYKYRNNGGSFLQHLSQLPGDHGPVYKKINSDGVISLQDTNVHTVRIEEKDAYLNVSQLNFAIQYSDNLAKLIDTGPDNYQNKNSPRFAPNSVNVLEKPDFEIYLPEFCLYDTIQSFYFRNNSTLQNAVTASHQVNDASIPIHGDLTVRIKPTRPIPNEWKDKIIIQRNYRNNNSVRKAEWQGNDNDQWLSAKFDDFGTYQAFADLEPPTINELGKGDTIDLSSASRIIFQATDNSRAIKDFRAELDGQWLRFTNDKNWSYIYIFDEHCPYGVHQLKLSVADLVGNTTTKSWWFKRYPYTAPKKKVVKKKLSSKKVGVSNKKKTIAKKAIPKKK